MKYILITILTICSLNSTYKKRVSKNGMIVSWHYTEDLIHFAMKAPTSGWVTIGFNDKSTISGAYLLMGRIVNGKAEVAEMYTSSPGRYYSIKEYGEATSITIVKGNESNSNSSIYFCLPITPKNKYQRSLKEGSEYYMTLAYSTHDNFSHHSRMRTTVKLKL